MILQKFLFPKEEICTEKELYYRYSSADIAAFNGAHPIENEQLAKELYYADGASEGLWFKNEESLLKTDTYFNAFSICKWKKYTTLSNLSVSLVMQGDFLIIMKNVYRFNNQNEINVIRQYGFSENTLQKRTFNIPLHECFDGLIYIEIKALKVDGVFIGGYYETNVDETNTDLVNDVKIAIDICTFRREEYIEANIEKITKQIIKNPTSPLYQRVELYVSDNGRTLDYSKLNSEYVHVYPNKNLGGAGGFGRSMYEILKDKDKKGFTHIIMMDDDVKLDPQVLERNYAFLRLLKSDYSTAFIGGAMLTLGTEWLQSESGDLWYTISNRPVKSKYDLRRILWVLKNEKEDTLDYFGWWYCCMPIHVVNSKNLPLPLFIKRDDIEYGLRNGSTFINLNGICVWHEGFDEKRTAYLDYYYQRNQFIIDSRHRPSFRKDAILKYIDGPLKTAIENDIMIYHYKNAHLKLCGVDDFLRGIDWLKKQDGEVLNNVTMQRRTYRKVPIDQLGCTFTYGIYENSLKYTEDEKKKKERLKTHNGWDVAPTKEFAIVPIDGFMLGMVCGVKRVLFYDETSNTGYVVARNEYQRKCVWEHFAQTRQAVEEKIDAVCEEYDLRMDELTNVDFWEKYLFTPVEEAPAIPVEWWERVGDFASERIKGSIEKLENINRKLKKQQSKSKHLAIKKNRIVLYLENRRGLSCNIKYILLELLKQDKLDIIFVSDFAETCDSVHQLGVKVVQSGTPEHEKYHLTAKVVVTNDGFPADFIKRKGQYYVNTWHAAMNYKTIGFDSLAPRTAEEMQIFALQNPQPDIYLSGSQFFTDDTSASFHYDKNVFCPTGMARNDIFFRDTTDIVKRIREQYNIPENVKIALYAPTFRRGFKIGKILFDFNRLKKALSERFGGEWVVMYRGHYFVKNNPPTDSIDVSRYEDMQELMCAADILISDYSSCLWDFTFTGKPAFVFASDLASYTTTDRGFALPLDKWPYPVATTSDELCNNIKRFDASSYAEKVQLHHEREGAFEYGVSAKKACEIIMQLLHK